MANKSATDRSLKDVLFPVKKGEWTDLSRFWASAEWGWVMFIALVVALTAIINIVWEPLPSDIREGSIASRDILSDRVYNIVDKEATRELQEIAKHKVLPVFVYDTGYAEQVSGKIELAFDKVRDKYNEFLTLNNDEGGQLLPQQVEELRTLFTDTLGVSVSVRDFESLVAQRFDDKLMQVLKTTVSAVLQQPMVEDVELLKPYREEGVQLLTPGKEEDSQILKGRSLDGVPAVATIKESLKLSNGATLDENVRAALTMIAQAFVIPTAIYSPEQTESRQQDAIATVETVIIRIQPGESIIRRGDRFEARDISIIEGIRQAKAKRNFRWKFVGTALFLFCFLTGLYAFAVRFLHRFHPNRKDLVCMGLGLIATLATFRLGLSMGHGIRHAIPFDVPLTALFYIIPAAGGAMVIRMVRTSQEAFVFAIAAAVILGFAPDMEFSYVVYYLLGGIVGAGALNRADSRSALWKAGLMTGLFQMFVVFSLELTRSIEIMAALEASYFFWNMGAALLGGLLAALFTQAFASLAESIFGYVTDIKLLELSSLNHPLLRELIVRAPGTYHHSHLVGTLAESACRSIGANGLFARVAAYFHDIGKMTKADYFIENQAKGMNRHEGLTPSMSALVIQNHVKDGIELARKYGLPEPIVDIIPQHQGTKLIRFFYSKAKEQEDPSVSAVSEKDYRYPGPKPQTREAGVILLSDGVEAATRALTDKSPTKIRATVEKLINMNFTDGQLDECELSLRDIHDIGDSFINILIGIYHKRIEYPDIPAPQQTRVRQGIHGKQDQHTKPESAPDSSPEETKRVTRNPLRDISRQ